MMRNNVDSSNNRLRLVSRREVERRVEELLSFYRELFSRVMFIGERVYDPVELMFTQEYLESDKLALVLRAMLLEVYNAPIIVVIGGDGVPYVVDGHHRALVSGWLRRRIIGYTLLIPDYKPRVLRTLLNIDIINPPEIPEYLACWRHIVNIIRFLEKQHNVFAEMWLENLLIEKLRPTELLVTGKREQLVIHPDCPILVYHLRDEYYVIDGHHRVCNMIKKGVKHILSLVFNLRDEEIGIIKTTKKIGYSSFIDECYDIME